MDDEYSREQQRRRQITMADPNAAKAKVIELRQQRKTYRQIGNTLGIGETTARLWADSEARDRDLQRRRDKYKSNPEPKIQLSRSRRARKREETQRQVMKLLASGKTESEVVEIIGEPIRKHKPDPRYFVLYNGQWLETALSIRITEEWIVECLQLGMTVENTAKHVGVHIETVKQFEILA